MSYYQISHTHTHYIYIYSLFRSTPSEHGSSKAGGWIRACRLPAYTTATATWDPSHTCDLHQISQQCRSLTHWVRLGIEPTSSWILVGFITFEPQQGLKSMLKKGLNESVSPCLSIFEYPQSGTERWKERDLSVREFNWTHRSVYFS